ncbi:MAG: CehA/McbA family metallohydrolase [candidate division FCPU426 bacterium]
MWFRGNLHCHTNNSDGDSPPSVVAKFYKDAGFHFLAISDHNHLTQPSEAGELGPDFLLLPASEYTAKVGEVDAHLNGIALSQPFVLGPSASVTQCLQSGVDQALAQGALAMINHPNWRWSFGASEIAGVKGAHLFELYNGAHDSNNQGSPTRAGTEAIWDTLLSKGIKIWGAATDDCHRFARPFHPMHDLPCSGWCVVEAESLSQAHVIAALRSGRFYATNRVELESWSFEDRSVRLWIKPEGKMEYVTNFIGQGGKILSRQEGLAVSYAMQGNEGYLRARIDDSSGHSAWIQPRWVS